MTAWGRALHKFCSFDNLRRSRGYTGPLWFVCGWCWKVALPKLWYFRHLPVKSVLRLDSVEQSFDIEPLVGRSWENGTIVTILVTVNGEPQGVFRRGSSYLLRKCNMRRQQWARHLSHGSPNVNANWQSLVTNRIDTGQTPVRSWQPGETSMTCLCRHFSVTCRCHIYNVELCWDNINISVTLVTCHCSSLCIM